MPSVFPLLLIAALVLFATSHAGNVGFTATDDDDRVYLLSVSSLTFTKDGFTKSIRGKPHEQLVCVGGDAKDDENRQPVRVDCYNVGIDENSDKDSPQPKWHCVTALHRGVTISDWSVHCEGYSYPGDVYVVKGSCWLEYRVDYEEEAPGKQPDDGEGQSVVQGGEEVGGGFFAAFWDFFRVVRNVLLIIVAGYLIGKFVWPRVRAWYERRTAVEDVTATAPLTNAQQTEYASTAEAER